MSGFNIVPREKTPVHVDELRMALHAGYHALCGADACPGDVRIVNAWAQCVFEHGWEQRPGMLRGLWCFNLGNIDAPLGTVDPVFVTVPEREIVGGRETRVQHTRRAFTSLDEGALAYWTRMREDFPRSFDTFDYEPDALAHALKSERYYTGDEREYAAGLTRLQRVYEKRYDGDDFLMFCGWIL